MAHYKGDNICACAVLATHIAKNNSDVKFFHWSKSWSWTHENYCAIFKDHTKGPGMNEKDQGSTFRLYLTPNKQNDKKCMYIIMRLKHTN